jgi:hypothetical protein
VARKPERAVRGLAGVSVGALHAELRRRERVVGKLERKRDKILSKLAAVEKQIAREGGALGARRGGGRRGGRRGGPSLVEALRVLLTGKTMSVTEAAEEVQKAGYQTTSPNFRTMVNQSLLKKDIFKRTGRGMYTAK